MEYLIHCFSRRCLTVTGAILMLSAGCSGGDSGERSGSDEGMGADRGMGGGRASKRHRAQDGS